MTEHYGSDSAERGCGLLMVYAGILILVIVVLWWILT